MQFRFLMESSTVREAIKGGTLSRLPVQHPAKCQTKHLWRLSMLIAEIRGSLALNRPSAIRVRIESDQMPCAVL